MKAWLITWEWSGEYTKVENPIAAILSPRLTAQKVSEIVELLYVNQNFNLSERIAYSNNKKFNPYPAKFDTINGVPWESRIYCGHNPYLFARKVDKLKFEKDKNGEETLIWEELPKPNPKLLT